MPGSRAGAARRSARRPQGEAEWFAEAAPGEPHGEVAGAHGLAVAAGQIARGLDAIQSAIDQAGKTCLILERAEMRDEVGDQVARAIGSLSWR